MNQVVASYRSLQADLTSFQTTQQRSDIAFQVDSNKKRPPAFLNNQQKQIVDDVDIDQQAVEQFEQTRRLANYLQEYLDYLKGRGDKKTVRISPVEKETGFVVAAQESRLDTRITAGSITEKTLELTADFDDAGKLRELSVHKTETTIEFVQVEATLTQRGFFARG